METVFWKFSQIIYLEKHIGYILFRYYVSLGLCSITQANRSGKISFIYKASLERFDELLVRDIGVGVLNSINPYTRF